MTTDAMRSSLERWDDDRRRWVLYHSQAQHSADCDRYPFETMPVRIFLDTCVVNLLVKHSGSIFESEPISTHLSDVQAHDVEALMHLMQAGARASWIVTTSPKALEEISRTPDPYLRGELLSYANEFLHTHNESYQHSRSLGRRSVEAPFLSRLKDAGDRELIGNAVGLGCDTFCTSDRKTIVRFRESLPEVPIRILTPIDWWRHFKPWAGLF